ncbi:MAG: alanine racemase [Candidatus Omnitrophica bacterium CG1_02_49_10]|nr:MAG: alanine racemase [Candidatus Omnitrophica bacterium CG1_02_49_10]
MVNKMTSRPTWAEVDLSAIRHNFSAIKKLVAPGTKTLVALKADAYGHGIVRVSKELDRAGADYLGVATVDEGILLRKSHKPGSGILVLSAIMPHEARLVVLNRLIQTVSSIEVARALNKEAARIGRKASIHIKVDTGMGRIGVWHEDAPSFVAALAKLKHISIDGIFTHFPSADEPNREFTNRQIRDFDALIDKLDKAGIHIPLRHAANSLGIADFEDAHYNMVRPGINIYGLHPAPKSYKKLKLKPAFSLKSRIVYLKDVPAGRSISYGRTYITERHTRIATLPIGYGDGYNRLYSNRAHVLIKDKMAPVVGRVCMDQTMIDVGDIPAARVGDVVTLIGSQSKASISAEELARIAGTIPYEVICWISDRVPRLYHK